MSSWTPKQALSKLMQRFQQSDSGESSNSSWDSDEVDESGEMPLSPLAMMDERSPEAWLGNFLALLGVVGSARYSTIAGSRRDEALLSQLTQLADSAHADDPMRLFEQGYADTLKKQDWSTWWHLEGELGRYCYSVMSLALLGDTERGADLAKMYSQPANGRIHKDAHYVICFLLGKSWPSYNVTEGDLRRLGESKDGPQQPQP